jgi:hypothetical protein
MGVWFAGVRPQVQRWAIVDLSSGGLLLCLVLSQMVLKSNIEVERVAPLLKANPE